MAIEPDTGTSSVLFDSRQNVTNVEQYHNAQRQFISHEAFRTYTFVSVIISESLSVLGVVTNTINIIVFVKLGLRETTSISMLSLAVSDLLISLLALWSNLLYLPQFENLGLPIRLEETFFFTGGITRQFVARTSAVITTFITVERCLCVMMPLKVKDIITRLRAIVVNVIIFAITIGPSLFVFGNYRIGWYFYPDVNRTLLGARYVDEEVNYIVDRIVMSVIGSFLLQFSFVATCLCTVYLVIHLRRASKFRQSHAMVNTSTLGKNSDQSSQGKAVVDGTSDAIILEGTRNTMVNTLGKNLDKTSQGKAVIDLAISKSPDTINLEGTRNTIVNALSKNSAKSYSQGKAVVDLAISRNPDAINLEGTRNTMVIALSKNSDKSCPQGKTVVDLAISRTPDAINLKGTDNTMVNTLSKNSDKSCPQGKAVVDLAISRTPDAINVEATRNKLSQAYRSGRKEDRIIRTVVIIAVAFILCFSPGTIAFLLYVMLPGFTLYGIYGQIFRLVFTVSYITEAINSSINLFIYYIMATNFRNMVDDMFGRKEKMTNLERRARRTTEMG